MPDGPIEVFGNVSQARIELINKQMLARQYGWQDEDDEPEDALDA